MQKVALIIKQKQINAVESIGNQKNQIRPCRLCLQFNSMRLSTSTPTTQRIQLFHSKFPTVFHYQKMTDHSPCLPHFLLLNADSKSSSRTDEIRHNDCHVKFENNTSGRARLRNTALKFLCPALFITSPDHLDRDNKRAKTVPCWPYRHFKHYGVNQKQFDVQTQTLLTTYEVTFLLLFFVLSSCNRLVLSSFV